jgi:hypothetical protein
MADTLRYKITFVTAYIVVRQPSVADLLIDRWGSYNHLRKKIYQYKPNSRVNRFLYRSSIQI